VIVNNEVLPWRWLFFVLVLRAESFAGGIGTKWLRGDSQMPQGYRERFSDHRIAAKYDLVIYSKDSVSDAVWQLESAILEEIVAEMRQRKKRIEYLDFACGTGRIISFLEDKVDSATGIDVSQFMLNRAANKVKRARFLCRDITLADEAVEGQYDLITCFRFLKNAEADLRQAALRQLAKRLRDADSRVVVNCHGGNPFSFKIVLVPYHWLKALLAGREHPKYVTNRRLRKIIRNAGLKIEKEIGYGFISGKLYKLIPSSFALWLEGKFFGVTLVQALGANQIFICRLP
jgi:SAM-dependent methyltransferase